MLMMMMVVMQTAFTQFFSSFLIHPINQLATDRTLLPISKSNGNTEFSFALGTTTVGSSVRLYNLLKIPTTFLSSAQGVLVTIIMPSERTFRCYNVTTAVIILTSIWLVVLLTSCDKIQDVTSQQLFKVYILFEKLN